MTLPPHGGPDLRSAAEIRDAERELRRAGIVESVDIADGIRQLQAERLALIGQVTRNWQREHSLRKLRAWLVSRVESENDRDTSAATQERRSHCDGRLYAYRNCLDELEAMMRHTQQSGDHPRIRVLEDRMQSLHAAASEMRALLLRTMTDSTVTTSDDPGCFHCDSGSGHSDKCEAVAAVVRYGQVTRLQERLASAAGNDPTDYVCPAMEDDSWAQLLADLPMIEVSGTEPYRYEIRTPPPWRKSSEGKCNGR